MLGGRRDLEQGQICVSRPARGGGSSRGRIAEQRRDRPPPQHSAQVPRTDIDRPEKGRNPGESARQERRLYQGAPGPYGQLYGGLVVCRWVSATLALPFVAVL